MKSEEEIKALRECHLEEFGSYSRSYASAVLAGDDDQAACFLISLSRIKGMIDAYRVVLE
jgi:hypothetical protein